MNARTKMLAGLAAAIISLVAYAFYRQYTLQYRLDIQLQDLDWTLYELNDRTSQAAENSLKGIEAAVIKKQSPAQAVAVLQAARRLRSQTKSLLATLRTRREALLRATDNEPDAHWLRHRNQASEVAQYFGPGRPAEGLLQQQVAAYVAHTRPFSFADTAQLSFSIPQDAPVVVALAALTQLEADVLAREARIQQTMSRQVVAKELPSSLKIMAAAASNTVAPGEVYRAELVAKKVLVISGAQLYCNGRPIPVGPDGIGHVSFQAPNRPGPASWLATMRIRVNGRDTTFQRRVPYRVARR